MVNLQEQKLHLKQMLAGADGLVRGVLAYFPPVQINAQTKENEQTIAIFNEYERLVVHIVETILRYTPTSVDRVVVVAGAVCSRGGRQSFLSPVCLKWQETQSTNVWFPTRFMTIVPTLPPPIRNLKYTHKILPPQTNLMHTAVAYNRWNPTKTPYAPRLEVSFSLTDMEQAQWGTLLYGYAPNQKPEGFLRFLANWGCNGGAKMVLVGSYLRIDDYLAENSARVYYAPAHPYKCFADVRMHPLAQAWIHKEEYENNANPDE